jgi:hypothetical protein
VATREDVALHQQYIADIEASSRKALASVNPGPIFKHHGVLGGTDIEVFTRTTTFAIM